MPTLAIAGDLYPGAISTPHLVRGDAEGLLGDLMDPLRSADLRLVNLEGPLVEAPSPIAKIGPGHSIAVDCVRGLRSAGFDVANLGNNHAMDHGPAGLATTMRACREQGIATVGAGIDLPTSGEVLIRKVGSLRLGMLSYTEHEFGIATPTSPGTNPLDLIHFVRTVQARGKDWDYLVVLLHGGNEYYAYPRPQLREICRFLIEQGARAVILQHSHCAGCYETYRDGVIVHGQGNFVFDERSKRPCEQDGFLVMLDVRDDGGHALRVVPFEQRADAPGPRRLTGARETEFLEGLAGRSRAIAEPGFVEKEWEAYTRANADRFLSLIHGYHRRIRELDQKFHFLRPFYSQKRLRMLLHLLRCESHRETLIDVLSHELR